MNNYTPPRAFLSHASDDKERFVLGFAARLRSRGVDVWLDQWEINPGDNPVRKIFDEGLASCGIVILVMSATSATKPWVREELDAAFVRKVEGEAKLIPIRLDQCEMPVPLKTTHWQAIDDLQNYDAEFERILSGIFGNYPKPELGPPPNYVQSRVISLPGLSRVDALLLERAFRIAVKQDHAHIEVDEWLKSIEDLGLTMDQISDSQQMLEDEGLIMLRRVFGPHRVYGCKITNAGIDVLFRATVANHKELIDEAAAFIAREFDEVGRLDNHLLAQELKQPLLIVEHVMAIFESNGLIQIFQENGGYYKTIGHVSAKLKRMVAGDR